ncbi:MAG: hypothetical protein FWE86_05395, partial [Oscillospiraceae bacterium]|nr:hypothetical protein [Oscillospiraceae bacterium]
SGGGFRYGGIARPVFSIAYVNQRINIAFVVLVVLGGAAVLSVIGIFSRMAIRKSRGKKRFSEDEITLEAVQSVALANLPAEQQTISELPPELSSRQVVVIQPRQDDGLDEHGDEPENAWLFGTALKMMSVLCFALFFVNFASISTEDWRSTLSKIPVIGIFVSPEAGLTGYKIAGGAEIFGVQMPGWPLAYCLVAAPVVIFLLMSFRRKLPKLLASAGTLAISVSQIFLLLFMPPVISQNVEIIRQSTKNYVTDPVLGMGYNYSLVIYILLTVGTLILMISDILEAVKKKGRT